MCFTEVITLTCHVCDTVVDSGRINVLCRDAQRKGRAFGQCTGGREPDRPQIHPKECDSCARKREDKEDRTSMKVSKQKTLRDLWNDRDEDDDCNYGW